MECERFDRLVDSYLDGQLSGSLLAEFHAHRLACPRCSRVVSMLQAAGDVITHDRCEPRIAADFASRVVMALPKDAQRINRSAWLVRLTASAAGLAAAAAIVMAAMLSTQAPVRPSGPSMALQHNLLAIHRTVVAEAQAISDDWGRDVPAGAVNRVHREQPSDSDLLTGGAVRGAVDRVIGWTEYGLHGQDQAK